MSKKDIRKLICELHRQGFDTQRSADGHTVVFSGRKRVSTLPGTPSDHRGMKNELARLRRSGFLFPH